MPLISFKELMRDAEKGNYAVGYFESWNLESLLAIADAAEAQKSPVIIGISGIDFPNYEKVLKNILSVYSNLLENIGNKMSVPVCTIFNECPHYDLVFEAINAKFGIVMYINEKISAEELIHKVKEIAERAHEKNICIEGEIEAPLGLDFEVTDVPESYKLRYTDLEKARKFIEKTGIDSLSINIGQAHIKGDIKAHLDLALLEKLKENISIPLVLHGASSIHHEDINEAIKIGIRKINVGRELKQSYFSKLISISNLDISPLILFKVYSIGVPSFIKAVLKNVSIGEP
ncbi:MAG: class II fructose-bisphosphate aldolase, partial [Actinobacteria bacterium]|nr:class II fructose-bisphosphate aldolase [Actinomycetota bacterium]